MTLAEFTNRLRDRFVVALHQGRLRAGDRLPSIRDLAREYDQDHRAVARAYRALEAEGLVEVRTRSGVYVARQERAGGEAQAEMARWMASVLTEGWKRRIPVSAIAERIRLGTTTAQLRCACVESTEDAMTAICSELRDEFGIDTLPVPKKILADLNADDESTFDRLPAELSDADLIVASVFSAGPARQIADRLGKKLVVLAADPELMGMLEQRLHAAPLTVVCTDPAFGERMRSLYDAAFRDRIRVVLTDDDQAVAAIDPTEPVFLTRAARTQLGELHLESFHASSPLFAAETARELSEIIIHANLEAMASV
ncbi:MAG: winged helix-turn-helix domain-containing protein [Gemmatimonadota bacterium]|nr:winged helix-turn-helix domain-containing protein [Gemmatimonadota bacterium]